MPGAWRLALVASLAAAAAPPPAAPAGPAAPAAAPEDGFKLIGYFDADTQGEMPVEAIPCRNLTHLVVRNAVKVDRTGQLHYRPASSTADLAGLPLIQRLAALPLRLVVSLRGLGDDVALDELSENDTARENFALQAADHLLRWGAQGFEVEWHSEDPGGGKPASAPFDPMEQYHLALLCRDLSAVLKWSSQRRDAVGHVLVWGALLSVAVAQGRQEFPDGATAGRLADWLAVRAHGAGGLGGRGADAALDEWASRGVPRRQLVLSTPLLGGAPAAAPDGPPAGAGSARAAERAPDFGAVRERAASLLEGGFGGLALQDLRPALRAPGGGPGAARASFRGSQGPARTQGVSLVQTGLRSSRTSVTERARAGAVADREL